MTSPAKTNDQNNRRSSVRSCVGLRVRACQGQHSVELRTSDVSTGGARLELAEHHEFRIGEDLDLELHVPGVAHPVKVSGEVRWGAAHACGVRFRAFAEKAGAAVLATFLATMPAGVSAKSAIPEFDPDNFTVDLNQ